MSIDKTTRLTSTLSEVNANQLLTVGWTLLLVADRQQRSQGVSFSKAEEYRS